MKNNRDSSYTLCKGFIRKIIKKNKNVKNINIDILDISDFFIKTNIYINGKTRSFYINIEKPQRTKNTKNINNLKYQNSEMDEKK